MSNLADLSQVVLDSPITVVRAVRWYPTFRTLTLRLSVYAYNSVIDRILCPWTTLRQRFIV